jgi:outer membrane immunogenic protein
MSGNRLTGEFTMKKLLLGFALGALAAAPAFAADMAARPYTKAPMVAPVMTYDWSGIYVGGAVGGEWNTTNGDFSPVFPAFSWRTDSHSDWTYGGFAGIQKQWGSWVLGIEGGWNGNGRGWGSTVGNAIAGPCGFVAVVESCQARITDEFYVGGKVGYAVNRWMVYGQGGYARAHIETQGVLNPSGVVFSPASNNHGGWYAGAGVDYAVLDYVILGIDYKHYGFDAARHDAVVAGDSRSVSAKMDAVMGRVTFKFNPWPMAVVAKY